MLALQTPTPIGDCRKCVFVRPGVFYIRTDDAQGMVCHPSAAESLLTDEILAMAQGWECWLLFTGLGLEKILNLWPAWGEALEPYRHIMTTKDVRRIRHGHR